MVTEKEKIIENILDLAEFTFENGEILNAYNLLMSAPILVREDVKNTPLFDRIKRRIEVISGFQNDVRYGSGFSEPPYAEEITVYQHLYKHVKEKKLRRLVDVGCFSGWIGRNLALEGVQVLGIDLDPDTIYAAERLATGTIASFEVLEGTKLGSKYQNLFDGAILFDVVEHVFDPHVLMKSVHTALKPGGWVFVNLPAYVPERDLVKEAGEDRTKEHLRAFTLKETEKLYPDADIEQITNEDGRYSYFIVYQHG